MEQSQEENYPEKARKIFGLLNQFRQNPKQLVRKLELLRTYLDKKSKVLSEPGKVQIQMMEGDSAIKEAINFLKELPPLDPLEWDDNLAASAQEHVDDIGPQGALSYQSSDGTEPEDRISKYGTFTDSLGENIDFGPNDALGVIISLTLDDGEEDRPHRDNLFKSDYRKVGIACGPHKSEFQMCVMDFAFDFIGNGRAQAGNKGGKGTWGGNNYGNDFGDPKKADVNLQMNKTDIMNNSRGGYNKAYEDNMNNTNPIVKLSLEPEEFKMAKKDSQKGYGGYDGGNDYNMRGPGANMDIDRNPERNLERDLGINNRNLDVEHNDNNPPKPQNYGNYATGDKNEIDELAYKTKEIMSNMKVIEKKVEVITKITYVYEDGSTKEVTQTENHSFKC